MKRSCGSAGRGLLWREIGEQLGMSTPGVHRRWTQLRDVGQADPMPAVAANRTAGESRAAAGPDPAVRAVPRRADAAAGRGPVGLPEDDGVEAADGGWGDGPKDRARHPADDMEILRLRSTGLTWREVAAAVGMTRAGVTARWRLLRRADYEDPVPPDD